MAKAKKKSLSESEGVQQEITNRLVYEIKNRENRRQTILERIQKGYALESIASDMHPHIKHDAMGRHCELILQLCNDTAGDNGSWDLSKVIDIFLEHRYMRLRSILGNRYACNCTSMMVNATSLSLQEAALEGIEFADMMLSLLRPFDTEGKITTLTPF